MIEQIIRWSLRQRVLVLLLALLLSVWGVLTMLRTPLDAIPDLSDVQVIIKTSYPGQAPQVVEDQVTYPLTTAMLAVPGAVNVRGYSFFNDSYVYVIFAEGTDLYWARSRVLEYLSQVAPRLPATATPALGPDATGVGWVYQYALVDRSGERDLGELTALQDWFLQYELQTVPGVAEVATIGGMTRQYQVVADPDRLRSHNITLTELRAAISNGNRESGGRVLELAEAEYMIRASGYIDSMQDLEQIPLRLTAAGVPVLLRDVAEVRMGPDLRRGIGELNGAGEAVGGVIIMRFGDNALATIARVKARLDMLRHSLPAGVEIIETYDRSTLIQRAVATLQDTLLKEFVVVALVCLLFLLHLRSALVVLLTLPLGILVAFIIMDWQGINANIMSLGGIAIAIGAMVDAVIVMIENQHRHLQQHHEQMPGAAITPQQRWRIVADAASEVGPALFFSLLIIALSFVPMFALEAQEGRLFKPLAYTKTWAMVAAAGIAITLGPVLMGYLVRGRIRPEQHNPVNRLLLRLYQPLLQTALRHPGMTLLATGLLLLSAWWPISQTGSEFMPQLDEGDLLYMPSAFPAASAAKMSEILSQTNRLIMSVPEVLTAHAKAGRADTATDPAPLTMIETTIRLRPRSQWRPGMTMAKLKQELDARLQIPGLSNVWIMPIRNRIDMLATGIKTPVGIKIAGPDLDVIAALGEDIETALRQLPGTASVYAERVTAGRYVMIDVDRSAAARHGMNIDDVHNVINTAIGGMNIGASVEGLQRFPINLRYPQHWRDSLARLKQLPVLTAQGEQLPLAALADLRISSGPGVIRTENARPNGWVYVDVADSDIGGYVQRARQVLTSEIELPTGYTLSWSGQYEYLQRAAKRLQLVIPAVLAIIIMLLYLHFGRLADVLIILGTLPLALVGGYWLLYLLQLNLSVAVAAGFVALAGVAIEIGVLMLVYLQQSIRSTQQALAAAGESMSKARLREAISAGALQRIRPIMMTVTATIAGLLPIMFSRGTGSEVMRPIATPMVGGMLSVTVLTLLVVPVVYYLWGIKSEKIRA